MSSSGIATQCLVERTQRALVRVRQRMQVPERDGDAAVPEPVSYARQAGIGLSARGRFQQDVLDAYEAASDPKRHRQHMPARS